MGGAARPLHDPGNHRSIERGSNPHAARCGSLRRPAKPAGERENDAALTPQPGTRSSKIIGGDTFPYFSLQRQCRRTWNISAKSDVVRGRFPTDKETEIGIVVNLP